MPINTDEEMKIAANKIVNFISDYSGQASPFENAKAVYDAPKNIKVISKIFKWWRQRSPEFDKIIQELKKPGKKSHLVAFQHFISQGGWTLTSANTTALFHILNALRDYEDVTIEDFYSKMTDLRKLISNTITEMLANENSLPAAEKAPQEKPITPEDKFFNLRIEERKVEVLNLAKAKEGAEKVRLFLDEIEAKEFALNNPALQVFHLAFVGTKNNKPGCQLTWYDFNGRAERLQIPTLSILNSLKVSEFGDETSPRINKIKAECNRLRQELLEKTKVMLYPQSLKGELITSTYILILKDNYTRIDWYDSIGQKQPVNLQINPKLEKWLESKATLTQDDLPTLKTYLRTIVMRGKVDEKKCRLIEQVLRKDVQNSSSLTSVSPGKLKVNNYAAVASLFGHKPQVATRPDLTAAAENSSKLRLK